MGQSIFETEEARTGWTPPAQMTSHARDTLPQDADFFTPPTPDVGEVITAWTTLRHGKQRMAFGWRLLLSVLLPALIAAGVAVTAVAMRSENATTIGLVALVVAPLLMAGIWVLTGFEHKCSYVGVGGLALYTVKGSRDQPPREELLLFENAANLNVAQTRQYVNGVYNGTNYSYTWSDDSGRPLFTLKGVHRGKNGDPPAKDPWHFAASGERAWNVFLAARLQAQLERSGYVEFKANASDTVRVGIGFLEFELDGNAERLTPPQIKRLSITQGMFYIDTHEARWLGRKGKYRFNYSQMANGHLFLYSLQHLVGYRFDGAGNAVWVGMGE